MVRFISKPILTSQTTGELLGKVREGGGLSLGEVARKTGIKAYYLQAIETGRYNELPGDIYTLEFVRTYARFLRLPASEIVGHYVAERERFTPKTVNKEPRRYWPRIATVLRVGTTLSGVAILVYASLLGRVLLQPPKLEVSSPTLYYESTGSLVVLSGKTEPGSRLFVNNKEVKIGEQGDFNETFNFAPGLTILKISSQDKHGRTTTTYRTVRTGAAVAGSSVSRTLFYGPMANPN